MLSQAHTVAPLFVESMWWMDVRTARAAAANWPSSDAPLGIASQHANTVLGIGSPQGYVNTTNRHSHLKGLSYVWPHQLRGRMHVAAILEGELAGCVGGIARASAAGVGCEFGKETFRRAARATAVMFSVLYGIIALGTMCPGTQSCQIGR